MTSLIITKPKPKKKTPAKGRGFFKHMDPVLAQIFKYKRGYLGKYPGTTFRLKTQFYGRYAYITFRTDHTYFMEVTQYWFDGSENKQDTWTDTGHVSELTVEYIFALINKDVECGVKR